jgi:hypothetical protein
VQTAATAVPTPTPLPTGTATRTPTATRTRAPSPTAGPSPTPLRPTPPISRKFGTVTQIDGYLWTIREVDTPPLQVLVDASTEWVNNPQLGDRVEVVFAARGGALVATRIVRTGGPVATPEPFDFSGLIQELNGEWWKVRGISFRVSGETEIEGDPAIDRFAEVHAERRAGEEIWARRITVKTLPEYEFTGAIEETGPSWLRVRGVTVSIDQRTQYLGDPPMVGRLADVQAVQIGEGRLMARIVYTWPITPTPTITSTRRPTRTPTPTASRTATVTSTPSPLPQPTSTSSATATAPPTPSRTLTPTATNTRIVTASPTATASATPTRSR